MPLSTRYCFFDTETSDMIKFKLPNSDPSQPWIVQYAALVTDSNGRELHSLSCLTCSDDKPISPYAEKVHKISKSLCDTVGIPKEAAISALFNFFDCSTHLIAHNIDFDLRMLKITAECISPQAKEDLISLLKDRKQIDTMKSTTELCQLPYPSGRAGYKWPKLEELYHFLFETEMTDAHDAMADVRATAKCYFELKRRNHYND